MRFGTYRTLGSREVIVRFCVRIIILVAFAAFAGAGFGTNFAALLWMSAILSVVLAAIRREPPLDRNLNHWDEAAVHTALWCLVSGINQVAPA